VRHVDPFKPDPELDSLGSAVLPICAPEWAARAVAPASIRKADTR